MDPRRELPSVDRVIGALTVYHADPDFYNDEHRRLLDRVAEQAAAAISNSIVFEQTRQASLSDPLTGLPNSRFMLGYLGRELSRAERLATPEAQAALPDPSAPETFAACVLDGRERSNLFAGGRTLFEHSVLAAGALADAFLTQGNRVGLLIYSQYLHWTWPGYGKLQKERILHALSGAAPGASQIFDGLQYLPARVFPPESQIVLVSPLVEDDYTTLIQLRARGYQVMVVVPDPVSFEQSYLLEQRSRYARADVELATRLVRMERDLLMRRMQRAGLHIVEWNVAQPFDQAMRRAAAFQRQLGKGRL